jgi:hypothetical protein
VGWSNVLLDEIPTPLLLFTMEDWGNTEAVLVLKLGERVHHSLTAYMGFLSGGRK